MKEQRARILIVDDEPDMAKNLELALAQAGHETIVETESTKALAVVDRGHLDLVVSDLRMPELDGLKLLERIKDSHPDLPVIMMTGYASVDSAVEAMKKGASDYIAKPFSPDELLIRINKALTWSEITEENRFLREQIRSVDGYELIIGQSRALLELLELVKKVAPTDARVLVEGESGTGKELIARCIHRHSLRQKKPFFAVNCGSLSENLLESELFGHERGAFTGAVAAKRGIFDIADGGTLFLDEICDTSMNFQTKLLRVVQDGEFLRVGGTRPLKSDTRIICATNREPSERIANGLFREDLFYRISVVRLHLPPLRERVEDIPLLAAHFVSKYSRRIKKKIRTIGPKAKEALSRHKWRGNIRELENVVERAIIMAEDEGEIRLEDLPADILEPPNRSEPMDEVRNAEKELILRTLQECHWNRSLAARKLGIGRRTLYEKIARHRISLRPSS